jgi:hypothetical protein
MDQTSESGAWIFPINVAADGTVAWAEHGRYRNIPVEQNVRAQQNLYCHVAAASFY